MESKNTSGVRGQLTNYETDDEATQKRLDRLLKANREIASQKTMFRSDAERIQAGLIKHSLGFERTFAYFGLLLGLLPPASIFLKFYILKGANDLHPVILILLMYVILATAVTGYFSGRIVGIIVRYVEQCSLFRIVLAIPLVGLGWGAVCGGTGGFFFFVFGALFGAIVGGAVGAITLPLFVAFHLILKRGELMDLRHFLPVSFGVTLSICSFILGR